MISFKRRIAKWLAPELKEQVSFLVANEVCDFVIGDEVYHIAMNENFTVTGTTKTRVKVTDLNGEKRSFSKHLLKVVKRPIQEGVPNATS